MFKSISRALQELYICKASRGVAKAAAVYLFLIYALPDLRAVVMACRSPRSMDGPGECIVFRWALDPAQQHIPGSEPFSTDFPAGKLPAFEEVIDRIGRNSEEFGSHLDIEDLGSPGGCEAGPALLRKFGRHGYVFVWD
jgi:hypothetical protein